jgi:uncharacterized protein (DUF1330 family)
MAAFIIFMNDINDPDGYNAYLGEARKAAMTGKVRIFGDTTTLEGTPPHGRTILIEFPDRAAAEAWYHSPEYQAAVPMRQAATAGFGVIVDGLPE